MQRITSRQNAVIKEYREAARGETPDTILLDGAHLVSEALAAGVHLRHALVLAEAVSRPEILHVLERIDPHQVSVATASSAVMDAASPVRSSSTVVALAALPTLQRSPYDAAAPLVVIVCDVQNPGNVGAIVRVAEAAGATGVVVAGQSADPFGWKALRGSMGSTLRLPVARASEVRDAIAEARHRQVRVIALMPRGGTLPFVERLDGPVALLVGGEGLGLGPNATDADVRVSIPMARPVESLNVAVAAAVVLYEAHRQRLPQS